MYGPEQMKKYNEKLIYELPPHIYAIGKSPHYFLLKIAAIKIWEICTIYILKQNPARKFGVFVLS